METNARAEYFRDQDPEPGVTVPDLEIYLANALEVAFKDPGVDYVYNVRGQITMDVDKLATKLIQIIKEKI